MKDLFKRPEAVTRAAAAQKGKNWLIEILVFIAVFVIVSFGEILILLPGELVLIYTNAEYQAAAAAQDADRIMEISAQIAASDIYTVLVLFANIAMILLTILFCKGFQKRSLAAMGFTKKNAGKEYLIGMAGGFLFFSVAVLIGVVTGALRIEGLSDTLAPGMLLLFFVGYLIQGMAEEVLCRGYLMVSVGRRYPMIVAVLLNALVFAGLHGANAGLSPLAFVNLFLFGVFASAYFIRRGSIWGIGAFHSVWNFVQGNFYGIRVSGMETSCSVFETAATEGKELLNGGAFGLEGSLGVTLVLAAGILFLCLYKRGEQDPQGESSKEKSQDAAAAA